MVRNYKFKLTFATSLLAVALILLAACGTLEMDVEPTVGRSMETGLGTTTAADSVVAQATQPVREGTPLAGVTPALAEPEPAQLEMGEDGPLLLVGRAMTIDPFEQVVQLLPEGESPLADEFGVINVRISEWAHIADGEGNIVTMEQFGRGVKLELQVTLQKGELIADEVTVLAPGNPPPGENPAMTDVTGMVTPIAESPSPGQTAIQLFELESAGQPLDPGDAVTLRWAYTGELGTICSFQVPRPVNQTCYPSLPPSGEMVVAIPAEARDAIDFTLYVQLPELVETAAVRATLSLKQDCQDGWFYEPEAILECPAGPAVQLRAQAQEFENGMMIRVEDSWLGEAPYIFVWQWYDDACQGQYCAYSEGPLPDTWEPGIPETDLALRPPEGMFQPTRGFGLLWRGDMEIPQMGEPRFLDGLEQLGWATGRVFEFDTRYQCESLNENFGIFNCHLELPDGRLAVLPGQIR